MTCIGPIPFVFKNKDIVFKTRRTKKLKLNRNNQTQKGEGSCGKKVKRQEEAYPSNSHSHSKTHGFVSYSEQ